MFYLTVVVFFFFYLFSENAVLLKSAYLQMRTIYAKESSILPPIFITVSIMRGSWDIFLPYKRSLAPKNFENPFLSKHRFIVQQDEMRCKGFQGKVCSNDDCIHLKPIFLPRPSTKSQLLIISVQFIGLL